RPAAGAFAGGGSARRAAPSLSRRLAGFAATFLRFGPAQIALALFRRVVFRRTGLAERDCDRLFAVLHLAAAARGLQLAMLVLMHDALDGLLLRWALMDRHRACSLQSSRQLQPARLHCCQPDTADMDLVPPQNAIDAVRDAPRGSVVDLCTTWQGS